MKDNPPPLNHDVLMIVNTYAPDDPRVIFSAASLVRMGCRVRLIGAARSRQQAAAARQAVEGVDVRIVPMVAAGRPLQWLRALWQILRGRPPALIAPAGRQQTGALWMLFFSLWVLRIGLFTPARVVHCHDLSPLPAAWLLARLKRARLIYDIHENVPTMYPGRRGRVMTWLERRLVPRVDLVIAAGERLAQAMPARGARQVVHIGNWKRLADYAVPPETLQALRERHSLRPGELVISHIGTLDSNRELPPLLAAAAAEPEVRLLIGGRGHDEERVMTAAAQHANITWLGWVDLTEVPAYTALSDAIYYCRSPQHYGGSYELAPAPNKLYEAFAAGTPLIARRGVGEIGAVLEEIPAGILLDDVTPESIRAAFAQLRDPAARERLRTAALQARERYNWDVAEQRLQQAYQGLVG